MAAYIYMRGSVCIVNNDVSFDFSIYLEYSSGTYLPDSYKLSQSLSVMLFPNGKSTTSFLINAPYVQLQTLDDSVAKESESPVRVPVLVVHDSCSTAVQPGTS